MKIFDFDPNQVWSQVKSPIKLGSGPLPGVSGKPGKIKLTVQLFDQPGQVLLIAPLEGVSADNVSLLSAKARGRPARPRPGLLGAKAEITLPLQETQDQGYISRIDLPINVDVSKAEAGLVGGNLIIRLPKSGDISTIKRKLYLSLADLTGDPNTGGRD